jgi:hypothetical protein
MSKLTMVWLALVCWGLVLFVDGARSTGLAVIQAVVMLFCILGFAFNMLDDCDDARRR